MRDRARGWLTPAPPRQTAKPCRPQPVEPRTSEVREADDPSVVRDVIRVTDLRHVTSVEASAQPRATRPPLHARDPAHGHLAQARAMEPAASRPQSAARARLAEAAPRQPRPARPAAVSTQRQHRRRRRAVQQARHAEVARGEIWPRRFPDTSRLRITDLRVSNCRALASPGHRMRAGAGLPAFIPCQATCTHCALDPSPRTIPRARNAQPAMGASSRFGTFADMASKLPSGRPCETHQPHSGQRSLGTDRPSAKHRNGAAERPSRAAASCGSRRVITTEYLPNLLQSSDHVVQRGVISASSGRSIRKCSPSGLAGLSRWARNVLRVSCSTGHNHNGEAPCSAHFLQ